MINLYHLEGSTADQAYLLGTGPRLIERGLILVLPEVKKAALCPPE